MKKENQEMSKSALKNKKKREAKARAKQEQGAAAEVSVLFLTHPWTTDCAVGSMDIY